MKAIVEERYVVELKVKGDDRAYKEHYDVPLQAIERANELARNPEIETVARMKHVTYEEERQEIK